MPLIALHLPKSCTEAIMRILQIITYYVVVEKGMKNKGNICTCWSCWGWRKGTALDQRWKWVELPRSFGSLFARSSGLKNNYPDVTWIDHVRLIVLLLVEQLACTNEWHGRTLFLSCRLYVSIIFILNRVIPYQSRRPPINQLDDCSVS